jgi:multiple antibiotic resistance protein
MLEWHEYLEILTALIVIVDPIGAVPIFLGLTSGQTGKYRAYTARVASITAGLVLIMASAIGEPLLRFFGISIASFRVGGGILVLLMAISMMNARVSLVKQTPEESKEAEEKDNVAVVPLAIPLLAGPAAISTVIIFAHRETEPLFKGFLVAAILFVTFLTWAALRLSIPLSSKLGRTGLNNITRVMGLLLSAIAVEFIATGLLALFPGLQ